MYIGGTLQQVHSELRLIGWRTSSSRGPGSALAHDTLACC
jgi:hypothetical protein